MYEIRIYKRAAGTKVRISTIKKSGKWFGIVGWLRLWFTLRKLEKNRRAAFSKIAEDCSPRILNSRMKY